MIGEVFGWVKVIKRIDPPKGKLAKRGPFYLCECLRCGNRNYTTTSSDLKSGRIKSCGCFRNSQEFADARCMHGHRRKKKGETSRTYKAWAEMKRRCDDPQHENYKWYGGKGITYNFEWKYFENFLLDMGECPEGLELDRIDNELGYHKANCRWVAHQENCQNRGAYGEALL